MFDTNKIKFLFKCADCSNIFSVELEDAEDIKKVRDDKMDLECSCGGKCQVLRD